jgi:hypothetical protein
MRLTFTTLLPASSELVDDENHHLYKISSTAFTRTVTIQKLVDETQPPQAVAYTELATIVFSLLRSDTIAWANEQRSEAKNWLQKVSALSL